MASLALLSGIALAQSPPSPQRGDVHHIDANGMPIVHSVMDGETMRSDADIAQCIASNRELLQHVENLNGALFKLEVDRRTYYVRHADRMAIMSLIQRELTPTRDQINHAIYNTVAGGSGAYCARKLSEGVALADGIYHANLAHRKIR